MDPSDQNIETSLTNPGVHRSGFIALIGRPNVGKSTLLNNMLGFKLAAVSNKPQTTRNRIVGIHTVAGMQAVLLDTPGLHDAKSRLNRALVDTARSGLAEADVVCWIVDAAAAIQRARAGRPIVHRGHRAIAALIEESADGPDVIVLNKVDMFARHESLPIMQAFHEAFPAAELVPLSAMKRENFEALESVWRARLPEAPPMYPEDQIAGSSERFLVTELIREKVFRSVHDEIPYATAVEVEKFEERPGTPERRGVVVIYARIVVERSGQKGVMIGKAGSMLKRIGAEARADVERLLGTRVHLDLHVAVEKNWTENPRLLHELGIE